MNTPAYVNCNRGKSAQELIRQSEQYDSIVHAPYSSVIANDLFSDCDSFSHSTDNDDNAIVEYWGETWRVRLHHES